jgi:hypothetical protein
MPGIPHAEELWTSNAGMTFQLASGSSFVIQIAGATVATFGASGPVYPTGAQISYPAGTVAAPSFAFTGDLDTGIYRIGANNLGVAVNGAKVLDVGTAGLGVTGTLTPTGQTILPAGTVGAPSAVFAGSLTTGWYQSAADRFDFAASGTAAARLDANGLDVVARITVGNGTVASPSLNFRNDGDNGLYYIGANDWAMAVGGAIVQEMTTTGIVVTGNVWHGAVSAFGTTQPVSAAVFKVGTAPVGAVTTSGAIYTDGTVMKKIIANGTASNIET